MKGAGAKMRGRETTRKTKEMENNHQLNSAIFSIESLIQTWISDDSHERHFEYVSDGHGGCGQQCGRPQIFHVNHFEADGASGPLLLGSGGVMQQTSEAKHVTAFRYLRRHRRLQANGTTQFVSDAANAHLDETETRGRQK